MIYAQVADAPRTVLLAVPHTQMLTAISEWIEESVMYKLSTLGRFFLAIAMVAFGAQHFVYLDFVTRVFPRLPAWIPAHAFLACVFGALLLASGAAIMTEKAARPAALLLGAIILSSFALLYLPLLKIGRASCRDR